MRAAAVVLVPFAELVTAWASQAPPSPDRRPVIGVRADVVRVDAVVTDKDGRYVTDLGPADFELKEDGTLREISNFQYVVTGSGREDGPATPLPDIPGARSPFATRSAPRTMAIVVDDLSLSFESLRGLRSDLR